VALRKRVEVIRTNLSDALGLGVIIVGDVGCVGIRGKLYCDEEVFINRVLMEWGEKVGIHDENVMNYVNPKWSDHE
jgi:hypothetical protein